MAAWAWALSNWRLAIAGLALALSAGLYVAYSMSSSALSEQYDINDALQVELAGIVDALNRERAATLAAEQAAAEWTAEAAERASDLQDAIEQGKAADESYSQCMGYEWPTGVIERLPE